MEGVINTYKQKMKFLVDHSELPIFNKVYQEVQKLIREFHRQVLDGITIKEKKLSRILILIQYLFITKYGADPIDTAIKKILDEFNYFIANYFSNHNELPKNSSSKDRKSTMKVLQDADGNELPNDYKGLTELFEDGDGMAEYLDNHIETHEDRKAKKFYFQKKNMENFISDVLDSMDIFYVIKFAISRKEFREYLNLTEEATDQYELSVLSVFYSSRFRVWPLLKNVLIMSGIPFLKIFKSLWIIMAKPFRRRSLALQRPYIMICYR